MAASSSDHQGHRKWIHEARAQSDDADRHLAEEGLSGKAQEIPLRTDTFPGYTLETEIHRGGQGTIYRATQLSTGRRVAVKLMHDNAFGGPLERARFERETRVLAALQHPNIVAIHDGGSHDGRFFLVMDYIAGQPLDAYIASQPRPIRETLELFVQICEAVNAAHIGGIIHRDLKPANVRVDAEGRAYVLDFGLAKFTVTAPEGTGPEAMSPPNMTMTGQFLGSLPWAAPEQAEGSPSRIDTRTDVYALGVLFYQMLTGKFPYQVVGSVRSVLDNILRAEPIRPRTLCREIDDELETIILKCLSKERERRYQTAGELARDLRRYLRGEPIEAKRDSAWYVLTKSLRRYRMQAAAAAGFVVIITASAIVTSILYARTRTLLGQVQESSENTRREADRANQTAGFAKQMIAGIDPATAGSMDKRLMRTVLDQAALRVETELTGQPEVESEIRNTIGRAYQAIGELTEARRHLERSLDIRRRVLGAEAVETLASMDDLGMLHNEAQRYLEALPLGRAAVDGRRRVLGDQHPDTLTSSSNLAEILHDLGQYEEAEKLCRQTLAARQRILGDEHRDTLTSLNNLALICMDLGQMEEAERLLRRSIEIQERVLGEEHPHTMRSMNNLAIVLKELDRLSEAIKLQERTLSLKRRVLGEEHPDTLVCKSNLAEMWRRDGRLDDAVALLREVIDQRRRATKADDPSIALELSTLAYIHGTRGDFAGAEAAYREALAIYQGTLPSENWSIAKTKISLGVVLERQKKYADAEPLLLEGYGGSVGKPEVSAALLASLAQRVVKLYDDWDAAEPGTGKAEKAAQWRAKIPTTQPAAPTSQTKPSS